MKKKEIDKLLDEIIRAVKEVYSAGNNPFSTINWKKGRKTLKRAIIQFVKSGKS